MSEFIVTPAAKPADLLVRAAHVLDPRTGLDGPADVVVRGGKIAEIGAPGSLEAPDGAELLDHLDDLRLQRPIRDQFGAIRRPLDQIATQHDDGANPAIAS